MESESVNESENSPLLNRNVLSDNQDKVADFKKKMENKDNRRLARYALSKSHGFLGNLLSASPFSLKYKVYQKPGEPDIKIDEITDTYKELLNNPTTVEVANSMSDILLPDRSKFQYFKWSIAAVASVLVIFGVLLLIMFLVKPDNNKSIIIGLTAGVVLSLPLAKLWFDAPAIIAWVKTSI